MLKTHPNEQLQTLFDSLADGTRSNVEFENVLNQIHTDLLIQIREKKKSACVEKEVTQLVERWRKRSAPEYEFLRLLDPNMQYNTEDLSALAAFVELDDLAEVLKSRVLAKANSGKYRLVKYITIN